MTLPSLANCEWLLRSETQLVFSALNSGKGEARAVGGVVRNSLLGCPVSDVDIATTLLPEEVMEIAQAHGLKSVPTGIEHGTVTVVANGQPFEVTTLREDTNTDGRHAQVSYSSDWAVDAARRDFTMNALYVDAHGQLFDPLGGYEDLKARRVRFIGDAASRIREDYLRILRFFRFTGEYGAGEIDPAGLWACVSARAGLGTLSAERVQSEFLRLLGGRRARDMVSTMFGHGLLVDVLGCAPALDLFLTLSRLEAELGLDADPLLRLAALCVRVEEDADRIAERLRLSKAQRMRLRRLADYHALGDQFLDGQNARAQLYGLGEQAYRDQLLLAWSDVGEDDAYWQRLWQLPSLWQPPVFPLSGKDALAIGISSGPDVGRVLERVEAWWIERDFADDADVLRAQLKRFCEDDLDQRR